MAKYVITGGAGFVGRSIAEYLLKQGHEVASVSRGVYPELEKIGIQTFSVDISDDSEQLKQIFSRTEAVFHVASKVDMWGSHEDFYRTNVLGTLNVIEACKQVGVRKLIYTSSPSVVAHDVDLNNINEDYPYPEKHDAYYPETKAIAEKKVLHENSNRLYTIALRPHLIWGPGDTSLIPAILERASKGRLVQVGNGENIVDVCFIEDCVQAHILAEKALDINPSSRGKAYFISQGEPVKLWPWINEILKRNQLKPITRKVSKRVAMFLAQIFELVSSIRPSFPEPMFTKFLVSEMSTNHYFDISAAESDLGYKPKYSIAEAMEKTFGVQ
ncbi:MAG: NAD-dependent epimerase/dehydratase family protein [Bdellovibrionales bacterium]|nr:NAD-dependent epimerase/dehydratase family protein [Bdellovibrionales bacterium]